MASPTAGFSAGSPSYNPDEEEERVEEELCEDIQDALERGDTTFNFSHNQGRILHS